MMTLTQTMTLMYTKTPNLTSIQRLSLCTGLIINGGGWEMTGGIVLEEHPEGAKCWGTWGMSGINVRIPSRNGIREIWSP